MWPWDTWSRNCEKLISSTAVAPVLKTFHARMISTRMTIHSNRFLIVAFKRVLLVCPEDNGVFSPFMPPKDRGRGEPDLEPGPAPPETDPAPCLEAKITPAREQRDDLLALAPRERRPSRPGEGQGTLEDRPAGKLLRRALEHGCRRDHHVLSKRERGADVLLEGSIELLPA